MSTLDATLMWVRRILVIALIVMLTGLAFRSLGPPSHFGYTCWLDENGTPQCSAQTPGWMITGET